MQSHPVWAPPIILIKRGSLGVRPPTPVRYLDIPASFEGQPVDTLGAGDVCAAGYLAGLLIGLNLPQAVRLADMPRPINWVGPDGRVTRIRGYWKRSLPD